MLQGLEAGTFDFVVSNPPYVGESEEDQVQLEVRKYEPRNAVFRGATGLEVIERLIPQARESLKPGGWLVMEISGTIAERVRGLLVGLERCASNERFAGNSTSDISKNHVGPDALVRVGERSSPGVPRSREKHKVPPLRSLRFAPVGMTEFLSAGTSAA